MPRQFPATTTIEEIKIAIQRSQSNPNIGHIHQAVIKDGPRTYKIATILEILNAHTAEHHHYTLRLDSFTRNRSGWQAQSKRSILIDNENGEIDRLIALVQGVTAGDVPPEDGIFRLVSEDMYLTTQQFLAMLDDSGRNEKMGFLKAIIADISRTDALPTDISEVFESGSITLLNSIAVSARIVQYRRVLAELRCLVEEATSSEQGLQNLLEENPWLFGSEYSELMDRRSWTRDDRLDFMLRRTVDGYLEIIEIKTPFESALLNYDSSHDSYYPSANLAKVIGQVMRYIEEVERSRDSILARDGYDPLKIRARIIAGRDGDSEHQKGLHNLNAHLNRIEVITFDQLVRIGERVLDVFECELDDTRPI